MYIYWPSSILKLAHEGGRTVVHKPFKLMKRLDNIGYQPLEERTEKTLDYQFNRQRNRWAEFRSVQILKVTPSSHSNGTKIADLLLLSAIKLGINVNYLSYVFMQNHWINNLDLSEENGVLEIFLAQGFKAKAIKSSVFGSRTYFADGGMLYGQDNLKLVKRALKRPFK